MMQLRSPILSCTPMRQMQSNALFKPMILQKESEGDSLSFSFLPEIRTSRPFLCFDIFCEMWYYIRRYADNS